MLLEEQRVTHENLERLEQAVADRLDHEPVQIRQRLARDHEIAYFLKLVESESEKLLDIYQDADGKRAEEIRGISMGDTMQSFKAQLGEINDFYARYPGESALNLEKAYRKGTEEDQRQAVRRIESNFTGEEGSGRFMDLIALHVQFINLPPNKGSINLPYLQYLDVFDKFTPPECNISRAQKMTDDYFQYLKALQEYLERFMRLVKPLENLDKLFDAFGRDFEEAWKNDEVDGWGKDVSSAQTNGDMEMHDAEGLWCAACKRSFAKDTVYEGHLKGRKHIRNAEALANSKPNAATSDLQRFKERAVAEREYRIKRLAAAMQTERSDTKVNVERKMGMTERERRQELEALYNEDLEFTNGDDDNTKDEDDTEDKIHNPLKIPLGHDGKPIPFWLWKLHGLGVEFRCEICGGHTYMGRRAFDKHFNEPKHVYGLRSLGITNTNLFREITKIADAQALWAKLQKDAKVQQEQFSDIIEMEDNEGNVMPEKIYHDLLAQGIL